MNTLSRRQFVAAGLAGLAVASFRCSSLKGAKDGAFQTAPGCQVYGVREQLVVDLAGTLKKLYEAGYRTIEFCSPPGYSWDGGGFTPLLELSAQDIKQQAADAGLRLVSCHYGYQELLESLNERVEFAQGLGLEQMIVSSVGRPETMAAWMECADNLNKIGEQVQKAGMAFGFHNHRQEWEEMDGVLVFDALTERFDPKLVNWQFHLQNPAAGRNPVEVIQKYAGRILSLHIMDYADNSRGSVPVGQGGLDWPALFAAAQAAGVKNYFVEMDMEALQASSTFLQTLKI